MAAIDLNENTAAAYISRLEKIDDDTPRKWGTMTPAQMFAHIRLEVEASVGELELPDKSSVVVRVLLPALLSGIIPMPKGRLKADPAFLVNETNTALEERAALIQSIHRFNTKCEGNTDTKTVHPAFGPMTMTQWQRGHGLHLEHHLKQFGA